MEEYDIDNIAISEISDIQEVDDFRTGTYFLVSQPIDSESEEQEYISKKLSYNNLEKRILKDVDLGNIKEELRSDINTYLSSISGYNVICVDIGNNPFIISGLQEYNGVITNLYGYKLVDGMNLALNSNIIKYAQIQTLFIDYGTTYINVAEKLKELEAKINSL